MSDPTEAGLDHEFDDLVDQVFGDIIDDQVLARAEEATQRRQFRAATAGAVRAVLESSDLDIRTCQHELAYALAAYAGEDVTLGPPSDEFERMARSVRALIATSPRCQMKGAS